MSPREIGQRLAASFPDDMDVRVMFRALVRLLALEGPVRRDDLARALEWDRSRVDSVLARTPNRELDEEGNVVGAGLTLRPTPHLFEVAGRRLYTWCALDALIFPTIIEREAKVVSPCAGTGVPVRVRSTPSGPAEVDPGSAAVSVVLPDAWPDIRGSFCNHVHFFASKDAAESWLASRPNGHVLSVGEAYEMGAHLAGAVFPARAPWGGVQPWSLAPA